jgi:hypothetical protein
MAQNQITVDSEILYHLFLKDSQDDGVAKLLESVLTKSCRLSLRATGGGTLRDF